MDFYDISLFNDFNTVALLHSGYDFSIFVGEERFSKIENIVNEYEYQVCMLIRTGFTPSDICILMNTSKSSIANVRKKLYKKLTGRNGSSKDFDAYINSL